MGDIAASDISVCHRIGAKRRNGRPVTNRPVFCKFVSRNITTKVLNNKKNLAGKEPYDRVYVNEDLAGLRARLFAFARKHANVEHGDLIQCRAQRGSCFYILISI